MSDNPSARYIGGDGDLHGSRYLEAVEATRLPDQELLAGIASRDTEMTVVFVRRFQPRVFGVAMAVLADPRLAEDVAQQTFEQTLRHAHAYDADRGTVRRWVTAIAHNVAVDVARSHRRSTPMDPMQLTALDTILTETPEDRALAAETSDEVRAALATLPRAQRRALVMAGIYRMTAREISELEHIPLGTAKTRIRTAMEKLRACLVVSGAARTPFDSAADGSG